jgi:thymidine phosphorylase
MQIFNEQINELKTKRQEYAKIAAEAEVNGDAGTYEVAVNALIELNNVISSLMQTKANFDIINVSNSIATNMAMAVNVLDAMANGKHKMPDLRKIQKASIKVKNYIKQISFSQKAMGRMMNTSNPANKPRSAEEVGSVRPMIEAEISRLVGGSTASLGAKAVTTTNTQTTQTSNSEFDLTSEILAEKNRII